VKLIHSERRCLKASCTSMASRAVQDIHRMETRDRNPQRSQTLSPTSRVREGISESSSGSDAVSVPAREKLIFVHIPVIIGLMIPIHPIDACFTIRWNVSFPVSI